MQRIRMALVVALIALAACAGEGGATTSVDEGDDAASTTTAAEEATTTTTAEEEDGDTQVVGSIDDIPQECMDAFIDFLRQIEPIVEPVDWANATTADLEELGTALEPIAEDFEASTAASTCDTIELEGTDEEQFEVMIEIAEREAPGTVGYFEWIRDFAVGEGMEASGDCETDIAAMQDIVDQGGTMADIPLADLTAVGNLMTAIAMECPPERGAEFFEKEDVAAFIGSG